MEILVRIALDKFQTRGGIKYSDKAFEKMMEAGLQELLDQAENPALWRK